MICQTAESQHSRSVAQFRLNWYHEKVTLTNRLIDAEKIAYTSMSYYKQCTSWRRGNRTIDLSGDKRCIQAAKAVDITCYCK